jgi:hypothetical protein
VKLRSRGLGRKELVMDFREYEIARDGDEVVVSGTITDPVNWDFTIRISGADIPGMLRLGLHPQTLAMAARWALHRRSKAKSVPKAVPTVPVATRSQAPTPVSPRAVRSAPDASAPPVAPRPTPIAASRAAEAPPKPRPHATTPDFGAPRRRGSSDAADDGLRSSP